MSVIPERFEASVGSFIRRTINEKTDWPKQQKGKKCSAGYTKTNCQILKSVINE